MTIIWCIDKNVDGDDNDDILYNEDKVKMILVILIMTVKTMM